MSNLSIRHERLRLRQLRLLELIERHGSLRVVAEALNVTQPAVSQMLKDLEQTFGVDLVVRSARGVRLTPVGQLARERVGAALSILSNLASDLADGSPPVLRVGVNPAVLEQLFPAALKMLAAAGADIQYRLLTGTVKDMLDMLLTGSLDCYIGRVDWTDSDPDRDKSLSITPIGQTELVIVCGPQHPLAGKKDLTTEDLRHADWALQSPTSSLRLTIETMFRNNGLSPPVPLCEGAAGPHEMMRLAQWLKVLVCVPRISIEKEIAQGELCVIEVPGMVPPSFSICFVNLKENEDFVPLQRLRNAVQMVMEASGTSPRSVMF
ncbi:MAG: LysR family transcriptional regulator [Pararhodobacter sp.]|nr:LysR family transcriptional regulator [Pararhodobacter sp.]